MLLIFGLSGGASGEDEHTPPERTRLRSEVVEVPMDLSTGRPLVQVTIDGRGPFNFILDTGASVTVIDENLAAELGLPVVGEGHIGDPSNPEAFVSKRVKAQTLELGDLELSGVTLLTFQLRKMMGDRYGGILGLPDLAGILVTLDYPGRRVILTLGELSPDGPQVVAYQSEGGLISLPLRICGKVLAAHLDSGNPGTFMLPKGLANQCAFKAPPVEVGMAATVGTSSAIWGARIDGNVEVAGLDFIDPEVVLSDRLSEWANIGFDALQDISLSIDQKNKRLRMIRTGAVEQREPPRRRIGIMFEGMRRPTDDLPVRDGALYVGMVGSGSLDEKAGIRVGDAILSINERAVVEYVAGDLMELFGGRDPVQFEIRRAGETGRIVVE